MSTFYASLAICIYYRPVECLALVLESVLRDQFDFKQLELFICDDCCPASEEEVVAVIDKYRTQFGRISYFRSPIKDGFRKTHLLAKALEHADSEIFVFLDGDCVLIENALSRMVRAAKNNDALCQGFRSYLAVASISWAVENLSSIDDFIVLKDNFYVKNTKTKKSIMRRRDSCRMEQSNIPGRYQYASGFLMSIKTRLLKQVGINLGSNRGYMEDTDLAIRLFNELGIDLLEVKNAEVLHLFEHH